MPVVTLENRAFIAVSGPEAEDFLQGIVTTDVGRLPAREAWPGALLTPQGKIMFEFLIARGEEGFVLECAADVADALVRRLTMYRLRANIALRRLPEDAVTVAWEAFVEDVPGSVRDMRFALVPMAVVRLPGRTGERLHPAARYHEIRIEAAVTGAGEDGDATDFFPHDLWMDRNGGVSFRKGCYVGQEVVSRMQHRGTARRRLVHVDAETFLPDAGAPVTAGGKEAGILISVEGAHGLAVVRTDRIADAEAEAAPVEAGGVPVSVRFPVWSQHAGNPMERDATP